MMAVLPNYNTSLQIQAFHWLACTSQSVAHSQISDKASPLRLDFDSISSIVYMLDRKQTNCGHSKENKTCPGENLASYLCFSPDGMVTETRSDNATEFSRELAQFACLLCLPAHNLQQKGHLQSAPMILHIHLNDK